MLQARPHTEVEVLDLCRLSAEYGHRIHPWFRFHGSLPLKLMMDRLVCVDGGNPDPTSTHGKDALAAKKMELAGWAYSRHRRGRLFA